MDEVKIEVGTKCGLAIIDLIDYLSNANQFDLSKLSVAGLDVLRTRIYDLMFVFKTIEVKEN